MNAFGGELPVPPVMKAITDHTAFGKSLVVFISMRYLQV